MKRWKKCEDGFTLVEMIITIAISAVLVGTVAAAMGYISAGNARRSAARFNSKLNTAQTETMMRKDPTYLYLFKDNGMKVVLSSSKTETLSSLKGTANPTNVGGARVEVTAIRAGKSDKKLGDSDVVCIAFNKATGAYEYAKFSDETDSDFISELEFSGKEKYKITLVKMTGKHVMSK